jgi:hypothetical protein
MQNAVMDKKVHNVHRVDYAALKEKLGEPQSEKQLWSLSSCYFDPYPHYMA